jgi:hypothetical protein
MWTLYGLADIGALTGNIVRRWHGRGTADPGHEDEAADTGLLARRMSGLGVDSDAFARLEPALFGNLRTLCRECERPDICRRDLRNDPKGTAWEDYCPNAVVLNAVAELRWFRAKGKHGGQR